MSIGSRTGAASTSVASIISTILSRVPSKCDCSSNVSDCMRATNSSCSGVGNSSTFCRPAAVRLKHTLRRSVLRRSRKISCRFSNRSKIRDTVGGESWTDSLTMDAVTSDAGSASPITRRQSNCGTVKPASRKSCRECWDILRRIRRSARNTSSEVCLVANVKANWSQRSPKNLIVL